MEKKPRQALHRGLLALISPEAIAQTEAAAAVSVPGGPAPAAAVPAYPTEISLKEIERNPYQPRREFDAAALEELKNSIREHGVLEPVLLRRSKGKYELISGERRFMASRALGLSAIPAVVKEKVSDREMRVLALVENLQRADLNDLEIAFGCQELIAQYNYTHDQVAQVTSKSRTFVTNTLRLLKLPEEMQEALSKGKITAGHARAILSLEEAADRAALFKEILAKDLSVRQAEAWGAAASPRPDKIRLPPPPDIQALEARLATHLSTRVEISPGAKGGRLVIKFTGLDDLNRIVTRIEGEP